MTLIHNAFAFNRFIKLPGAMGFAGILFLSIIGANLATTIQKDNIDDTDTQAVMKANFLFHFAASNEWPVETKAGSFRMVVVENERLFAELIDKYALKPIGVQPLEIIFAEKPSDVNVLDVPHMIYVESTEELGAFAEQWEDQPILIVTDTEAGLAEGSIINFVAVDRRLRYEINAKQAAKKGLLIGSRILSWAINSDQ